MNLRRLTAVGTLLAALGYVGFEARAQSTAGTLDTTFASGGKYLSDLGGTSMFGPGVAVQVDGRVVVAGKHHNGADHDFATLRLTGGGALDSLFGGTGAVVLAIPGRDEDAKSVVLQPDGRILVGGEGSVRGYVQHAVMRYLASGSLDTTFGVTGFVSVDFGRPSHVHGMALQADGKLVIAGESYVSEDVNSLALARLSANGVLDTTFGSQGKITQSYGDQSNGHSVAIASDGAIIVGGYVVNTTSGVASGCFVSRFRSDGRPDTTFGSNGSTVVSSGSAYTNYCHKVLLRSDGKIVLIGSQLRGRIGDFLIARLTSSGALDSSFGVGGVVTTEFGGRAPSSNEEAAAGVLQPDGKLVAGGYSEGRFAVARYLESGSLDTSFGTDGKVTFAVGTSGDDQIKSLALSPDGRILAAGYARVGSTYRIAAARLQNDSGGAQPDSDRLFNWAEAVAPQYFSPRGPATQTVSGYQARVYANGNAIGTRDGHLFVYGTIFGGLVDIGASASFLAQAVAAGY